MFINEDARDKVWEACRLKDKYLVYEAEEYDVVAPRVWAVVDDYDGSVHLFFSKESAEKEKDFLEKLHGVPGLESEFVRVVEVKVEE